MGPEHNVKNTLIQLITFWPERENDQELNRGEAQTPVVQEINKLKVVATVPYHSSVVEEGLWEGQINNILWRFQDLVDPLSEKLLVTVEEAIICSVWKRNMLSSFDVPKNCEENSGVPV